MPEAPSITRGALMVSVLVTAVFMVMAPPLVRRSDGPPVVPMVNAPTAARSKVMLLRFRPESMRMGVPEVP